MIHWPKNKSEKKTSFGGLTRSALMSRIRGSGNATTELKFILLMRLAGLRGWRRNVPLLGKPDFTFPKAKLAVFIDGCFWHGHNCNRNLNPKHNAQVWQIKFARNKKRDRFVTKQLRSAGWSVVRVWECELAKSPNRSLKKVVQIANQSIPATVSLSGDGRFKPVKSQTSHEPSKQNAPTIRDS
jgi:DNA mismatch endonuclease (patch repair protein)